MPAVRKYIWACRSTTTGDEIPLGQVLAQERSQGWPTFWPTTSGSAMDAHESLTGWYRGFEVDNVESTSAEWKTCLRLPDRGQSSPQAHARQADRDSPSSPRRRNFHSSNGRPCGNTSETQPIDVLARRMESVWRTRRKRNYPMVQCVRNAIRNSRRRTQVLGRHGNLTLDS